MTCLFADPQTERTCNAEVDSRVVLEGVSEETNRMWEDIEEGCQKHIKQYLVDIVPGIHAHSMGSRRGVTVTLELGSYTP